MHRIYLLLIPLTYKTKALRITSNEYFPVMASQSGVVASPFALLWGSVPPAADGFMRQPDLMATL